MSDFLKMVFSLSLSGSLLILVLFLLKPLLKNKISKQWQYSIWLVVIVRLLLPFTPKESLMGTLFSQTDQTSTQTTHTSSHETDMFPVFSVYPVEDYDDPELEDKVTPAPFPLPDKGTAIWQYLFLGWLGAALLLLIRKITVYQSFANYIRAGREEVSDIRLLDRLAQIEEQMGVKRPVELYTNSLISSPLLLGFFRPCIILPTAVLPEIDFQYTVWHELTHYKRLDMFYKWLVQLTVCLHWFNPLVWLMEREINRACELACDEAVIQTLNPQERREYGDTLLHAMGAGGAYQHSPASVTLNESAELLKERLHAIMNFKKTTRLITILSLALTAMLLMGATTAGAAVPSALPAVPVKNRDILMPTLDFKEATYYLVYNEAQLQAIGTGEYGLDKNYMQQADIQMSSEEWVPIGTMEHPFTGSYNGNGFEIIGLTMTDPNAEIIGLFGVAENAHIYNITMRDYDILSAGKNVSGRSASPILALELGGVRFYDNYAYPADIQKEASAVISNINKSDSSSLAELFYENGSLPLFNTIFDRLNEAEQRRWLEKTYQERKIAFFSVCLQHLSYDGSLIADFAERAYQDRQIGFFSVLTDYMDEKTLEMWLDRALNDKLINFQSVLFSYLDRDWELEKLEAELDQQLLEEYRDYGITKNGKLYYYQDQLVNVFLDIHSNYACYALEINPEGTVSIRVTRDADDRIRAVDYMTEEEVAELFEDMYDIYELEEDWDDDEDWGDDWEDWIDNWAEGQKITIPVDIASVKNGEYIWLGTYSMAKGDRIYYHVSAETGERLDIGFAKPGQEKPDTKYYHASTIQPDGTLQISTGGMVWDNPVKVGEYRLFIHTEGGDLTGVKGSVTIVKAAAG